jgi:hypothetical protein
MTAVVRLLLGQNQARAQNGSQLRADVKRR